MIQFGAALPTTGPIVRALNMLDYPFVLPHHWTRSSRYREVHGEFGGTWGIVDNGMHETSSPMPPSKIAPILESNPGWVGILPDYLHRPVATWAAIIDLINMTGLPLNRWGIVLHGSDVSVMKFQFDLAHQLGFGLICFPYKAARWVYLHSEVLYFRHTQRYHLMGLSAQDDLWRFARLPGKWSLDTTKLWKIDLISAGSKIHGHSSTDLPLNLSYLKTNLVYLREYLNATSA